MRYSCNIVMLVNKMTTAQNILLSNCTFQLIVTNIDMAAVQTVCLEQSEWH